MKIDHMDERKKRDEGERERGRRWDNDRLRGMGEEGGDLRDG